MHNHVIAQYFENAHDIGYIPVYYQNTHYQHTPHTPLSSVLANAHLSRAKPTLTHTPLQPDQMPRKVFTSITIVNGGYNMIPLFVCLSVCLSIQDVL